MTPRVAAFLAGLRQIQADLGLSDLELLRLMERWVYFRLNTVSEAEWARFAELPDGKTHLSKLALTTIDQVLE